VALTATELANPTPALPAFSASTRLLVVAPHPDDETIATGLLIQQVLQAGGSVRILLLTDGDNNPWPQRWLERRFRIGSNDRKRWGARRRIEMSSALQTLGVQPGTIQSLGWPDMGMTEMVLRSDGSAVKELAQAMAAIKPNLLAFPALEDAHPDHGATHVLVRLALAEQAELPALLTYLVHGYSRQAPLLMIEGTPDQLAAKQRALAAHVSQMALSGTRLRRLSGGSERYFPVAIPVPLLPWQVAGWLQPWLRVKLVGRAGVQSWSWREAPLRRDGQAGYRLDLPTGFDGNPCFVRLAGVLPSPWIFDHWGWWQI